MSVGTPHGSHAGLPALEGRGAPRRTSGLKRVPTPSRGRAVIDDIFFRHMVRGMRNGVLAVTRDGSLAHINDEAYRIFGITPGAADIGRPVADVVRVPEVVRALTGAFEMSLLPNRAELRLRTSGRVIGYTVGLVRDDHDVVVGAAMLFKDLTRVEQLEERERLRDRLAAVGEMAAAIAHEVKNPLAGIEVMAGLLRRKTTEMPDAQTVLTDIIKEAKMANAIVQEVLDFVRPIRLQVERTNVSHAIRSAIQLSENKTAKGRIDIMLAVPVDLPLIQADEHQLAQVFTNLIINACEAMDGQGRITITAHRDRLEDGGEGRDAVRIEIADNGPGMPAEIADHVFAPFFTTKAQGSGLGLAIVRKIVDAHDGRIDLDTAPGTGTRIRITLPVSGSDDVEPTIVGSRG